MTFVKFCATNLAATRYKRSTNITFTTNVSTHYAGFLICFQF